MVTKERHGLRVEYGQGFGLALVFAVAAIVTTGWWSGLCAGIASHALAVAIGALSRAALL